MTNTTNLKVYELSNNEIKAINLDADDYSINRQVIQDNAPRRREETNDWMSDELGAASTGVEESAKRVAEQGGQYATQAVRAAD